MYYITYHIKCVFVLEMCYIMCYTISMKGVINVSHNELHNVSHKTRRKVADDRAETFVSLRLTKAEAATLDALWHLSKDTAPTRAAYLRQLIQAEAKRRRKDLKAAGAAQEAAIPGQMSLSDYPPQDA